ncbi:hypothetical protein [Bifidobacterium sp.]|uniref:hypothetical protein n=1 Tax=Bifidobacterium sp. TaxID=41200 RepID=UPI002E76B856|nr:hypothetical protein [Bifidobacterium sp.]MEE1202642.1 hypothetical protein [Bifidobacterium sp.]
MATKPTNMIVDECHGCQHYKRIDRTSRLCRACMGRADRDLRLRLYSHTDLGALRIDQIISRASHQAARQSGDYTANLERALTELGCQVTRLESIS